MTSLLRELCKWVQRYRDDYPASDKAEIAAATARQFSLLLVRSVYVGADFAVRFSHASGASFSNVVLSLSALKEHDSRPFAVCIVRPAEVEFLLANSTFLKRISHSSHQLRTDNIRGSFLGHDIARRYQNLDNEPANFEALFAIHRGLPWEDSVRRLVQATDEIVATDTRLVVTDADAENILSAAALANSLSNHPEYLAISERLAKAVSDKRREILDAATIDNVNLRGNAIEQIITAAGNSHRLEDLVFPLSLGAKVLVDVKT